MRERKKRAGRKKTRRWKDLSRPVTFAHTPCRASPCNSCARWGHAQHIRAGGHACSAARPLHPSLYRTQASPPLSRTHTTNNKTQRTEHHAGSPLATLEEAPLAHAGLEDFAAALAVHCRRVRLVHVAGNVVGRLDRAAMGKLKVSGVF